MKVLRRAILAASLLAGLLSPLAAIAQPAAVPALPDVERRTTYSISGSTCACAVNFAIYGDSNDVDSWIQVWVNGARYLSTDATFGWSLSGTSGWTQSSVATQARPLTDANLTFNIQQTGTVQIVGAERPRQLTQFSENQGVPARALNQRFTDITAIERELWDKTNDLTGRGLFFAPGNSTGPMPTPAQCANGVLGFDNTGLRPLCLPQGTGLNINTLDAAGATSITNGVNGNLLYDNGGKVAVLSGINWIVNNSFYVGGTGASDSNDCLAATVTGGHGPCSTIQHTINVAIATNAGGSRDTINLAAAIFTECINVGAAPLNSYPFQGPTIIINGAGTTSTTWNGCNSQFGVLIANGPAQVGIQNLQIQATGISGQSALYAQLGGTIHVFAGMNFLQASNCHFFAEDVGANIQIWNAYQVAGNTTMGCHASATSNAYIEWNPGGYNITLNTPETYSNEFYSATFGGGLYEDGNPFVGAAIGKAYVANMNGWILSPAGCAGIPGTISGTTATGGQCQ